MQHVKLLLLASCNKTYKRSRVPRCRRRRRFGDYWRWLTRRATLKRLLNFPTLLPPLVCTRARARTHALRTFDDQYLLVPSLVDVVDVSIYRRSSTCWALQARVRVRGCSHATAFAADVD